MGSSRSKNEQLFDSIRKKWVEKTPEELIRQRLLRKMTEQLGYPSALLAVEKELSQLPHLKLKREIPQRRVDLIVFAKGISSLFPLLMVECKAVALTPKFARQVVGYNAFVEAPFVALANESQILTGSYDEKAGMYRFEKGLPGYQELMRALSRARCAGSTLGE